MEVSSELAESSIPPFLPHLPVLAAHSRTHPTQRSRFRRLIESVAKPGWCLSACHSHSMEWSLVPQHPVRHSATGNDARSEGIGGHLELACDAKLTRRHKPESRVVGRIAHDEHRGHPSLSTLLQTRDRKSVV